MVPGADDCECLEEKLASAGWQRAQGMKPRPLPEVMIAPGGRRRRMGMSAMLRRPFAGIADLRFARQPVVVVQRQAAGYSGGSEVVMEPPVIDLIVESPGDSEVVLEPEEEA